MKVITANASAIFIRAAIIALLSFPFLVQAEEISTPPQGPETIVWDRAPLRITLPVNQERRVDFPVEIEVNIPMTLSTVLEVTPTQEGSVFFRAKEVFTTERLMLTDKTGQHQWLVDISAEKNAPGHVLVIHDSRLQRTDSALKDDIENAQTSVSAQHSLLDTMNYDEVDLIRVVARQFYGPSRLAQLPPGISGAPATAHQVSLYHGNELQTEVKGAWRAPSYGGVLYVTAIEVRNLSSREVRPDPRRVKGRLLAMSAQHHWLAPKGHFPEDTTLWYLVTDRPLQEVLSP